jgi:L-ribulose-5-phosphate 3-epimerase
MIQEAAMNRKEFVRCAAALGSVGGLAACNTSSVWHSDMRVPKSPDHRRNRIGVSTYSFWQFRGERLDVSACIDKAAAMGFDGVEILHIQMGDDSVATCNKLKRRAHSLGLALMGFSTHQGFVSPDETRREAQIDLTRRQIEVAAQLGIPTMRVNTGRWGTSGSFDELMEKKGIESPLPGYTDEDAFGWVIDAFERILPTAEKNGVVLGLENHWGLGRTAEGVLRIVETINSEWLQITLDTGNLFERRLEQIEMLATSKIPVTLVQAKTYFGGGRWYELDIDYAQVAAILREHEYKGWISLEFEGNEDAETGVPKSLALSRQHFR